MQKLINSIICDDCIELLSKVRNPFADLIFADPPFNIGYKYDKYKDKVKSKKYIAWTRDWISACVNVLKANGSFYIAISDDYAAHIRIIGEESGLSLRNWIIWHYTFGQQTKAKFARAHTHIFYFVKDKTNFTFNEFAVRVPSDRQLTYNDRRANPRGKMPDDVWNEYSRICGTFKERQGWHPCQMPETLLSRIIAVSSNPGDVVLDPFIGSGTTAAAAYQLGRKYVGIDISKDYAEKAQKRLNKLKKALKQSKNLFGNLNTAEILELKRLYIDIGIDAKKVISSKKLFSIFINQFKIRMNNNKEYTEDIISSALLEFSDWKKQN